MPCNQASVWAACCPGERGVGAFRSVIFAILVRRALRSLRKCGFGCIGRVCVWMWLGGAASVGHLAAAVAVACSGSRPLDVFRVTPRFCCQATVAPAGAMHSYAQRILEHTSACSRAASEHAWTAVLCRVNLPAGQRSPKGGRSWQMCQLSQPAVAP